MLCSRNNNNAIRDAMNATYRVVIKGVKDGFTEEQVIVKLAGLFKTSEEQAKKILVSGNFPVKKGIDLQTATKYQAAVEATGASVVIEPEAAIVTEAELPPKEIPAGTKKCSRCGLELPDTAKFCRSCGVSQIESSSPVKNLEKVTLAKTIIEAQQPAVAIQSHSSANHTEPKAQFGADGRLPKTRASKKIWLAGGAVVITGMAIAAAILLPSKHPDPQPAPIVSNAPSQPPQAAPAKAASNITKTVAGDLSITNKNGSDDTETKTITLAGKIVYDQSDSDLGVEQAFSFTGKTVLLLSISSGGSACPANYRFLTVRPNGEVTFTGEFGTCSDTPKVSVNQEEITVALPDMRGRGEEVWKYANNALSQIKYADANAEAKAERITLDENQSATIKGVLAKETAIRTGDGKRVEINVLKLASKSVIPGCDQHEALTDSIPIDDGVSLTQVQGKSVFQVTIACSNAGASISAISVVGEEAKQLIGLWVCKNYFNGSSVKVLFGEHGAFKDVLDPGTDIETSFVGKYSITGRRIQIHLSESPSNREPAFAAAGISPWVSIDETWDVISIDSHSLEMLQPSKPEVKLSCNR